MLATAIGCRPTSTDPSSTRAPVETASLDAWFRARFPPDQPGIAVLVAKRNRVVFARGYGVADRTTREPITPRTLFNVGSLTKTFVANAILIQHERGKLSLEDPLSKYFPSFKRPELAAKVRIRHLLTHTSGLPDTRQVTQEREHYLTARDAENWYPITQADALEFEPGSGFAYSNPAFNGLALIVEQQSGRRWQSFVRDEIFLPSKMTTSTITDGPHPERGVAHGYELIDGVWRERDYGEEPTFAAAGNGGVWSSVEELARYEQALRDHVFLSASTAAAARTIQRFPNWAAEQPPHIGYAWVIREVNGVREYGHTGSQGGFLTNYIVIADRDVLLVFLMNAASDFTGVTEELRRFARDARYFE